MRRVLVCCRYGNANTTGEAGKATPTITSNDGLIIGGISDTAVSTTDAAQPSGRTAGTAKSSEEELNHQTKVLRCVPHTSRARCLLPAACCRALSCTWSLTHAWVATATRLRANKAAKKIKAAMAAYRKELTAKCQGEWLQEELEARRQRGESTGIMAHASAMKTVMGRMKVRCWCA